MAEAGVWALAVAVAFLAIAVLGLVTKRDPVPGPIEPPAPLPVVAVRTQTGVMFTGRLRARDADTLTLAGALQAGEPERPGGPVVWTPVDAELVIPWVNVDYWQEGLPAEVLHRE